MEKLRKYISTILNESLSMITISRPRSKGDISKIKIRPVMIKNELMFQDTAYVGTKVIHKNLNLSQTLEEIIARMENDFVQIEMVSAGETATALVNRKGQVSLKVKKNSEAVSMKTKSVAANLSHNKVKKYILKEGTPVGFLIDLGVMTKEGKIVNSRYDKYKQINRFLEFVEDIVEKLPRDREVRIIDFGCGKSYLTFAMYYYLKVLNNYDIRVTGLDLKEDVIKKCNQLKDKYGYDKLEFVCGNVETYDGADAVDMVVTLHACDTATDYALHKAVKWGASVILSVPCCQHELNNQIDSDMLSPVLQYGLIKERMAALFTDGIRAELLKNQGYDVQILEFIDMEHTPKNIMIRAVKGKEKRANKAELTRLMKELNVKPTLAKLFDE